MTAIMVMTTMPLADAKARLSAVLGEVGDTHERLIITRNGRPEAVIISIDDLAAIEETLGSIRDAEEDLAAGEGIGADDLRQLMAERARTEAGG